MCSLASLPPSAGGHTKELALGSIPHIGGANLYEGEKKEKKEKELQNGTVQAVTLSVQRQSGKVSVREREGFQNGLVARFLLILQQKNNGTFKTQVI